MNVKTTAREGAPASVTATEIAQEVRRLDRRERLQKLGTHIGATAYFVRTHESPEESAQRLRAQLTDESASDRTLRLQKFILCDDVLEVEEGEREPPDKVYRRLTDEEVAETFADARALQVGARIRRLQEPIARAESDIRRLDGEIANSREILQSVRQRIDELEDERRTKQTNIERARKPLEEFFADKSEGWRARALKEAARTDRDALPTPENGPRATVFGLQRDRVVALDQRPAIETARAFQLGPAGTAVPLRVDKER
jgi:chromosome segregation ATPase